MGKDQLEREIEKRMRKIKDEKDSKDPSKGKIERLTQELYQYLHEQGILPEDE